MASNCISVFLGVAIDGEWRPLVKEVSNLVIVGGLVPMRSATSAWFKPGYAALTR